MSPGITAPINGLRVGLLARHTYNYKFIQFAEEKGFDCTIVYYDTPTELTAEERALLETMRQEHVVVRALMNPDEKPYSWFEDGEAKGIVPDIFRRTIEILGLDYEIVETSSRAKQDFFSKMSHDIRTPLNVVLGMTQIAQKYKGDPEKLDSTLDNIRVEGNQLLSLINSILDASQLEHGHVELVNAPF